MKHYKLKVKLKVTVFVRKIYCNHLWDTTLMVESVSFMADDSTLMAESEEELKSLLMKVKENEKVGFKLNIWKTKIMASGPITSWQIDRETVETMTDFILGGSKITADGDCSHEIKRHLLLGRKAMTNLLPREEEYSLSPFVCQWQKI